MAGTTKKWDSTRDRAEAFRRVFSTPDGEAVLSHLQHRFGLWGHPEEPNPFLAYRHMGQQDVVGYIYTTMGLTVAEAQAMDARTERPDYDPLNPPEEME